MRLQWMRIQLDIKKKSQEEFASLKFWYGFWAYSITSKYLRYMWGPAHLILFWFDEAQLIQNWFL